MSSCQHRNTTFSRDICPDPCGVMHTSCDDCYELLDDCAHDPANWTREQAQAAQAELDELERTDPDVAAAAASYDRMVERVTGHSAHRGHPMTGPAVDVEQLQRLADEASEVAEWPWSADFAGTVFDNAGFPIAGDVEDSDAALIVAAVNALPALLAALRDRDDRIRRQDAALTAKQAVIEAVTKTVETFEWQAQDNRKYSKQASDEGADYSLVRMHRGACLAWNAAANVLRAALASPDTTQED